MWKTRDKTLVSSINRQVNQDVDWTQYSDLSTLGVEEISDKKGGQDFLTIISARSKSGILSVIAILPDRNKETVKAFLESIPCHFKKTV